MPSDLDVTFYDRGVVDLLAREIPRAFATEMNRGYRRVASEFMKEFVRRQLRPGIYGVRRRVRKPRTAPGQPSLPAKAYAAGFRASIRGTTRLERKSLSIQTRNPLLTIREFGGVIRPRRHKYLTLRITPRGRGRRAAPTIRRVRQVTVRPVLRLRDSWREFRPRVKPILDDALAKAIRRLNRKRSRRAA